MMPDTRDLGIGAVYTETTVYSPPEALAAEAPYQIAIISLGSEGRITARIAGPKVAIGDTVKFVEFRNGVAFFQKTA